jgi:hypothetical protein
MASSGMLRPAALVRTDVSEKLCAFFIRVTRIGELGTTLAVTYNRRRRCLVPPKRRFFQEPHGVTSQKTPFLIVAAVKTSNLTIRKTVRGGGERDINCADSGTRGMSADGILICGWLY